MSDPYKTPESDLAMPEHLVGGLPLASRGLRIAGALLDGLFVGVPSMSLAYFMGLYENISPSTGMMPLTSQLFALVLGISAFMLINGVLIYKRGQTLGKMICGTKVVTLEGEQVNGNRYIFARLLPVWLVTQIPILGSIAGLVDSLLIFRKEHNCLHDDIAKTRVVKI